MVEMALGLEVLCLLALRRLLRAIALLGLWMIGKARGVVWMRGASLARPVVEAARKDRMCRIVTCTSAESYGWEGQKDGHSLSGRPSCIDNRRSFQACRGTSGLCDGRST